MTAPKKIKARYHRVTLKTGHIVEIGWSIPTQKYKVTYCHPDYLKEDPTERTFWNYEKVVVGYSVKEVISKTRTAIVDEVYPNVKAVRERVAPNRDTLTFQKLKDCMNEMKQKMATQNPKPTKVFVSRKMAHIIQLYHSYTGAQSGFQQDPGGKMQILGMELKTSDYLQDDGVLTDNEMF